MYSHSGRLYLVQNGHVSQNGSGVSRGCEMGWEDWGRQVGSMGGLGRIREVGGVQESLWGLAGSAGGLGRIEVGLIGLERLLDPANPLLDIPSSSNPPPPLMLLTCP